MSSIGQVMISSTRLTTAESDAIVSGSWNTIHFTVFTGVSFVLVTSTVPLIATFVGHRHVPSAANQQTPWRSLIRCCWTSRVEQSANPAARVGHYTRTLSTSTQNASIWSLTAAAPSDSVFVRCVQIRLLTYLPTYLLLLLFTNKPINLRTRRQLERKQRATATRGPLSAASSWELSRPNHTNFGKDIGSSVTRWANRPGWHPPGGDTRPKIIIIFGWI